MLGSALVALVVVQAGVTGDPTVSERIPPPPTTTAVRVSGDAIRIDGRLDDPAWAAARFSREFRQREPIEGAIPTVGTAVGFAFDDEALYVGLRMEADGAHTIDALMTRRDEAGNAERVIVFLDSYRDRRTAYAFGVTAAGVRLDWYHPDDDEQDRDPTFDPVWRAEVRHHPGGWTAELRIPFSQLRFNDRPTQTWGLNVTRVIPATNEQISWALVPRTETAWSSRFGALTGLDDVRPSRRVELMPYVASDATFTSPSLVRAGDPFTSARQMGGRVGADLKVGLGPNLTLDATFNPDFAQVEADPAQVNLSAFETVFTERRPFFTEGAQLFQGAGPTLFYSRRIGAAPSGRAAADFVDRPGASTILGAAKVTGRLPSGLSVGALAAVTDREYARTFDRDAAAMGRVEIAPRTMYGVTRVQQEFGRGGSTAGVTVTTVQRDFGDTDVSFLTDRAVAGGVDWTFRFNGGALQLTGHLGGSRVDGDTSVIAALQRSSAHYFQRPDQTHVRFDPTRGSLMGWTGSFGIEKRSGRHWRWTARVHAVSPGFEVNDAGQMNRGDVIQGTANLRYRETTPKGWLRNYEVGLWVEPAWNFGGHRRQLWTSLRTSATWSNFWSSWLQLWVGPGGLGDGNTRGGPLVHLGKWWYVAGGVTTNANAGTIGRAWADYWDAEPGNGGEQLSVNGGVTVRPSGRWTASADTRYVRWRDNRQYLQTLASGPAATFGSRYIFSEVDRSELSVQLRLNYSLDPDVSLELYAEPFAASGRFFGFGDLIRPRSYDLRRFGTAGTSITEDANGNLAVTADGQQFTIANPDFRVLSFRSNLVFRWEWQPGSTLFVVWQRNLSTFDATASIVGTGDVWRAFRAPGQNVLTLKVSYWIPVF